MFTPLVYTTVKRVLSDEIDEAGMQAVRAMAAVDYRCWKVLHHTVLEGREAEFADGKAPRIHHTEMEEFRQQRDANRARAKSIADAVGTKVLDAVILDRRKTQVINGRGTISLTPIGAEREFDNVTIQRGLYELKGQTTPARTYTMPIRTVGDVHAGFAVVALSEEKIGETLTKLLGLIIVLAIMFIVLGLIISWVVAQRITQPILDLTRDIEIVADGNLKHRTRAHTSDEIGVMASAFDDMTVSLLEAQELERKQASQEHEIGVARQVQEALFPDELASIQGYDCAGHSDLAGAIGGNYYDVLPLEDGTTLLVVASASGAGVPGAMVVTMARSLVKAVSETVSSPAALLRIVNRLLAPDLRRGMYVTMLLVLIDPKENSVRVANAGHPPLLMIPRGGAKAEPVHLDGIALGFDKGPVFDRAMQDTTVELESGDRLVLCTRSLFEVGNEAGEAVGEARLQALFAKESERESPAFVDGIMKTLARFRGDAPLEKDLVLLSIRRTG